MEYITGAEKSFGVTPFSWTTRLPLETTVMAASVFSESFATRAWTLVPGAATRKISLGSGPRLITPARSPGSPGFDAAGMTNDSRGPCPRPPLAHPISPERTAMRTTAPGMSFFTTASLSTLNCRRNRGEIHPHSRRAGGKDASVQEGLGRTRDRVRGGAELWWKEIVDEQAGPAMDLGPQRENEGRRILSCPPALGARPLHRLNEASVRPGAVDPAALRMEAVSEPGDHELVESRPGAGELEIGAEQGAQSRGGRGARVCRRSSKGGFEPVVRAPGSPRRPGSRTALACR